MIVVIVALEDEVNFGKMLEQNAGRAMTFRTDPGHRAGAFRPDRIAKNIDGVELDEQGRVADERDANGTAADAIGRNRARRCVNPLAPRTRFAIGPPLE